MQLSELDIQLSAFRLDVCIPRESLVQVKAKIFDLGGDWNPSWITKSTNSHSQYVILIAFPLQKWLQERA